MSFQWFFWLICVSLRGLGLFSRVAWLGTGQFRWSIGTNGSIGFHPHVREPKAVLGSGLYAMDSGFKVFVSGTWILDSNRHRDSGFLSWAVFRIPTPMIAEAKISRIPESVFPYIEWAFLGWFLDGFNRSFHLCGEYFFAGVRPNLFVDFILFLIRLCQKLKVGQFNVLY